MNYTNTPAVTIVDSDGKGRLTYGGQTLRGGQYDTANAAWSQKLPTGDVVLYKVITSSASATGKQLVISKQGDSANTITINNFDAKAAQGNEGYLGIKLDTTTKLALTEKRPSNFWSDASASLEQLAGKAATLIEQGAKGFMLYLSKRNMLMLVTGLALVGTAHAASFDCAKAQTWVEKLICSDAELSRLDDDLGRAWKQHLRDNKFQDQFKATQMQWLVHRDECADAACMKEAYQARLQQMASGKEYFLRDGQGKPLCENVVKAMNEELYRPGHGRVCAFDILQRLPGVQLPPWKKLDLQKDKELYKKFVLADYVWEDLWDAAFADPPPKAGQPIDPKGKHSTFSMPSDADLNREWENAVGARFEFYRWDNAIPLPEHADDFVLIRTTRASDGDCPSIKTKLFTSDLMKPKPYPLHSFGGGLSFSYGEKWYWLTGVVNSASLTDAFTIGQLNSVEKNYIHLMDICKVTGGQKSFKWE